MTETAKTAPGGAAYTPAVARTPPRTGLDDLLRLVGALAGGALRRRDFSARATFRAWVARTAARLGSEDLILDLGVKRVLLVGTPSLSRAILDAPPHPDGFVAGALKQRAMAFLAPSALTISEGEEWTRLRAFNERVLAPGGAHPSGDAFLACVREAFSAPVATPDDVRAAMGRAMLGIVFGPGVAPAALAEDVTALFGYVQSPVKRRLLAPFAKRRRARFYADLRRACDAAAASDVPSLVATARRDGTIGVAELVEQVPHWMFTFPGSGADLLTRTLALVCARPASRAAALAELASVGVPVTDASAVHPLAYLRACLREAADLYPPVTRTVHRAPRGATVAGVAVPAGMDVLHAFPPIADDARATPRRFRPERWLSPDGVVPTFDPFLGGARACPGRDLVTFVCTAALAILLGEQHLGLAGAPLAPDALPAEFPKRGIRFRVV
jgi:cytochrome P450